MENIMQRWRVKIKVFNRRTASPSSFGLPIYECTKWYDQEPDPSYLLNEVMSQERHLADYFYGEAVCEKVWHTNRTQFISA